MDILLIVLAILLLFQAKINIKGYFEEPFSKQQTASLNGFFVVLIFIRHFFQYVEVGKYDRILKALDGRMGQLIVVSFIFFSGYAIMLKVVENREYIETLPRKVFLLWIHFVLGVLAFLVLNLAIGNRYSLGSIILSLFGLFSIGNSTWYVVAILSLWLSTYFAFKVFKNEKASLICLFCLMIVYSITVTVQSCHDSTSARAVPLYRERQASKEEMP